jgi:hypothetical protein
MKYLHMFIIYLLLTTGCGPSPAAVATQTTSTAIAVAVSWTATPTVTATQIPTSTPTDTPKPTATPTNTPKPTVRPTRAPTRMPTATPTPEAMVIAPTLNIREGPGTQYAAVGQLQKADELFVVGEFNNCAWVQVAASRRADPKGWVSGDSSYLTLQKPCTLIPKGSFRPLTGLVKPNISGEGYGELTVDNGTSTDGVVILALGEQPVMVAYIRAGESFMMKSIPDGVYYIYFSTGSEWNGEKFIHQPSYQRFEDRIKFTTTASTYSIWSITLHSVVGGNAAAEEVDIIEFPSLGD